MAREPNAGAARQPGGPAGDELAGLAGRGAGAGRRPGKPNPQDAIDPAVAAAATLGLTGMESRVAVLLAEGMNVGEIAAATGRGESTIRSHVKHMFAALVHGAAMV